MLETGKRRSIDLLIEQFWKMGYMTVSRKFGTYLPEPSKIGMFEIDIVARLKNNYAIGITLTDTELNDSNLINKLSYLATRQTKYSNKKVPLLVGVADGHYKYVKLLIEKLQLEIKKNIKIIQIQERAAAAPPRSSRRSEKVLFS